MQGFDGFVKVQDGSAKSRFAQPSSYIPRKVSRVLDVNKFR
jgi:hypothetical protein